MTNKVATVPTPDDGKKTRHRSPSYPAVSLREAVERTGNLWRRDGKAGAPSKIAAIHIGFQTPHGQAMSVLAALKKFGLVEEMKDRLVPTQRAIEILSLREDDPRRVQALKDAALSPPIYQELAEQHRTTGLPDDDVLESELTAYKGFNPNSVAGFVKDFRDTLDYAELLEGGWLKLGSTSHEPQKDEEQQVGNLEIAISESTSDVSGKKTAVTTIRRYPMDISIPRNVRAELVITGQELKKDDLERLKKQLDRLIENLSDAFED
jgi:hypothetical protein